MIVNQDHDGGVAILRPVGRIDNASSAAFQDVVLASLQPGTALLIDLAGVEFISSAGLAVLMMAAKQAKAGSGRIAVAALRPIVQEIFTISRFSRVVPVYGNAADGVAALR